MLSHKQPNRLSTLRAARVAKVGAESTRLFKLLKFFKLNHYYETRKRRLLAKFKHRQKASTQPNSEVVASETRVLSKRLGELLSMRVAALVMIFAVVTPLLSSSFVDLSANAFIQEFSNQIESGRHTAYTADQWEQAVHDMKVWVWLRGCDVWVECLALNWTGFTVLCKSEFGTKEFRVGVVCWEM